VTLTEQDYRWLEAMKVAIEGRGKTERAEVLLTRNIALEQSNAALWAHVDNLTAVQGCLEAQAEKWRRRWAKCFGVILVEIALVVAWMIARYGH
jgi:hypothetical protein